MQVKEAEKIIEKLFAFCSRESMLLQLEGLNEGLSLLMQNLQESAATSNVQLQQYYKQQKEGQDHYLLQHVNGNLISLQFYDIITQKLEHIFGAHLMLIKDLRKSMEAENDGEDTDSYLLIYPELMCLHHALLKLIRVEYIREISQVESHFELVSPDQIPSQAVDIQLGFFKITIEKHLDILIREVSDMIITIAIQEGEAVSQLKSQKFQDVLSLFTMNSEREVFSDIFQHKGFMPLLNVVTEVSEDDDVELF